MSQNTPSRNFENVMMLVRPNFKEDSLDRFGHGYKVLLQVLIPSHNPLKLFPGFIFDSYIYCK